MASRRIVSKKSSEILQKHRSSSATSSKVPADAVDEQLARYRTMRDFSVTAEPSGAAKNSKSKAKMVSPVPTRVQEGGLPFVIQKHAASHLHYDFRLGWNGVLKSWAVAKGPSYVTSERRLAVQVEDHPMEYGGFEGIIPQGQYGGGTVMVWDQGTWAPQPGEDVEVGLQKGSLKFTLSGTKMHGKWTLVRMNDTGGGSGRWRNSTKPNWLLIKEHDDFERGPSDPVITEESPNSAVTGRTMEQIAQHEDHVWNSQETAKGDAWYRRGANTSAGISEARAGLAIGQKATKTPTLDLSDLPKEKQPDFIKPQLAQEVDCPPDSAGWLHELKLDGYRIQARKTGNDVVLLTRSGLDWTHRVPGVAEALALLPATNVTLDGEAVVLAENGTTNFALLQAAFQEGARNPITYFCFDLLHIEGRDPRALPQLHRKALLEQLLRSAGENEVVRLSEHLSSGGKEIFDRACELHAEGIVSKSADAPYRSGRGGSWLKAKCLHEQEFVVGGYTLSSDGDDRIGSLLLGYYEGEKLIYAGRSGTGFNQKTRRTLLQSLKPDVLKVAAFNRVPVDARRGAVWVKPRLVAQVRFATWTADNLVRQAAFLGLREDKTLGEVLREEPHMAPRPKNTAGLQARDLPQKEPKQTAPSPHFPEKLLASVSSRPGMRLTHPNKVVDPETQLTKSQLAEYYWNVAEWMLPHVADRPLSLVRCPEGAGKPCFYQKHVNQMLPPGVSAVAVPDKKTGVLEPYITLSDAAALAGLAQMGVLEIHPWGSRNEDLERPDRITFDLDPDESLPWTVVCSAAADVRLRLRKAGLESFLKTTGGKGLHIVVPIVPELGWADIKNLSHSFVTKMERANPALYLTKMNKAARKGKIFLDYLRNERGATAVAAYSPRARLGTNVSLPLRWSALASSEHPVFSVSNFAEWRSTLKANPWKKLTSQKQHLTLTSIENL